MPSPTIIALAAAISASCSCHAVRCHHLHICDLKKIISCSFLRGTSVYQNTLATALIKPAICGDTCFASRHSFLRKARSSTDDGIIQFLALLRVANPT
jgi:hypothetical protein